MSDRDPESWMWEKAREFFEQADKLQQSFFHLGRSRDYRSTWGPPADVFETDEALYIVVALPGVDPSQTRALIQGGGLLIRGERTLPRACRTAAVHRLEIPYGRFERHVELPPGCYEVVEQEFELGCLLISLRKVLEPQDP